MAKHFKVQGCFGGRSSSFVLESTGWHLDLNWGKRVCSPPPYHLAMSPRFVFDAISQPAWLRVLNQDCLHVWFVLYFCLNFKGMFVMVAREMIMLLISCRSGNQSCAAFHCLATSWEALLYGMQILARNATILSWKDLTMLHTTFNLK